MLATCVPLRWDYQRQGIRLGMYDEVTFEGDDESPGPSVGITVVGVATKGLLDQFVEPWLDRWYEQQYVEVEFDYRRAFPWKLIRPRIVGWVEATWFDCCTIHLEMDDEIAEARQDAIMKGFRGIDG